MRRPPLQLPAVVFSTGRFTPTQADATRAQNPVTANPEESILKGVGDVMSYPQRRMVEAITGTYQDPSAALGIQNPVAAFATDVVLDPTNAIPAGALAKLFGRGAKVAGAADEAVDLGRRLVPRPASPSKLDVYQGKDYIDAYDLRSKSIGGTGEFYRVPDELRLRMEQNITQGEEWLNDWYLNRTDKFKDLVRPKLEQEYEDAVKINFPRLADYIKGDLENFDNYIQRAVGDELSAGTHKSVLEPTKIMNLNPDVLGVSTDDFSRVGKYANVPHPGAAKNSYNYVFMAADQNPMYTAIHEGTHGMDRVFGLTDSQKNFTNFDFGAEVFENMKLHSPDMSMKDIAYYSDPKEIYARTNELRRAANLDPSIEVTDEMARQMLGLENLSRTNSGVFNTFLGTNPRSLARWMNTMPALAGAAMIGNQTQKK